MEMKARRATLHDVLVGKPDDRRSTLNFVLLMAAMALFAGAVPPAPSPSPRNECSICNCDEIYGIALHAILYISPSPRPGTKDIILHAPLYIFCR